jgi:hypothetical protein
MDQISALWTIGGFPDRIEILHQVGMIVIFKTFKFPFSWGSGSIKG